MVSNISKYHEYTFYNYYKKIRNLFRKFNPDSIFNACISFLHQPVKEKIDQIYKQPWDIFLLLKWVYSDSEFSKTKPNIDHISFDELRKLMYDIYKNVMPIDQYSHIDIYFRNKAFQQFPYQRNLELNCILRQKILIESIQNNHPIHKTFRELTGLNIQTFSDLSIFLLGYFIHNKKNTVYYNDFGKLIISYSQKQIQHFLSCISINFDQLRNNFVRYSNPRTRISFEYYEQTPFSQFPLIKFPSVYLCVSHQILFRCLETYVYDLLRANDSSNFMTKFGHVFEKYVEKSLKYSEVKFINETKIKSILGNDCRVVDFIVQDKNSNIFIEAKAVEMSYKGKFSPDPKNIERRTKRSIIDAIDQAHNINSRIHEINSTDIIPQKYNYLIVVTFKEMYLGNGKTYYDIVDQRHIDKIYSSYDLKIRIPLENMYFITISDFDKLMEHINENKTTFSGAIELAKKNDSDADPFNKKFHFSQHLSEMEAYEVPSFLEDEFIKIRNKVKNRLE
jgi:hypothetical protein